MHHIVQGDCLDIMRQYPDNYFDICITDPPYGIKVGGKKGQIGGGSKGSPTKAYGEQTWDKKRLTKEYFDEMLRISKNQIIWGGNYYLDYVPRTRCMLVWYKRDRLPVNSFADCEIAWTSFDKNSMVFNCRWFGFIRDSREARIHPTQKALELMKWCVCEFTKEGDKIIDPFLGSGTTMQAAKELGRECLGIEINPGYVEAARRRLEQADVQPIALLAGE
jgi:site-specific DNA-methyltransferase (adenine-specific)